MNLPRGRLVKLSLLSWLAFVAVDFLVHGVLLAEWYERGGPALLSLEEAFARIPLGYLAFFLLTILVVWLTARLGVHGAVPGFGLGLSLGSLLAASHIFGLVSITTIDPVLATWWGVPADRDRRHRRRPCAGSRYRSSEPRMNE